MAFIIVPSLLGQASRPNGNDHGKDPDQGGSLLYKQACSHAQSDCALTPPHSKKSQVAPSPKPMTTVEELLAQKAKVDAQFQALLAEV